MHARSQLRCPRAYTPDRSHAAKLLKILGHKNLLALQKVFGGTRIWVPKPGEPLACSTCRKREECIHLWRRQGHSLPSIAKRLSISMKSVYRALHRPRRRRPAKLPRRRRGRAVSARLG